MAAIGTSITKAEFYRFCNEKGFLGHDKKLAGTPNYTSIDGSVFSNRETGQPYHNGSFYVEPLYNEYFQTLVARALAGGVQLSISQLANEAEEGEETLFPAFFDIDMKEVLEIGMEEARLLEVSTAFFNIAQPMFEDDVWTRHMMDQRQTWHKDAARERRLPPFIKERWPSFHTVCDVLTAFQSNPFTMAEQPADSTFTLADLFTENVDAQNWLGTIVAAALAYHIQKIVRQFYPSISGNSKVFDILAMTSINGTSKASSKVGAHIHLIRLIVTTKQMDAMASAVENALVKIGGNLFRSTVDKAIYSPKATCIRMPFTWKAEKISNRVAAPKGGDGGQKQQQQKRPKTICAEAVISDDGKHRLIDKQYKCVAFIPASKKGKVDLESPFGHYLCVAQDVLMTIQASQLRLDQKNTKATPGFTCSNMKPTDIYTSSSIVPTLLREGYTQAEAAEKERILLAISNPIEQQNRLNIFVGEAATSGKKKRASRTRPDTDRFAYLPPNHKGFVAFEKYFPMILDMVYTKRETNGTLLNIYNGFTVGSVTVDKKNAVVSVQANSGESICCYNRKINGTVPHPHKWGNSVSFVIDGSYITQKCWNTSKSSNRAAGCPCKDWSGHKVNIEEEMMRNLNPRLPNYEKEVAKVQRAIDRVIPGILKDAMEDFMKPLPEPAEVVQSTLAAQVAHDAAMQEAAIEKAAAAAEAAVPSPLGRTQSFSFGGGSSRSNSPATMRFGASSRSSSPAPTPRRAPSFTFGGSNSPLAQFQTQTQTQTQTQRKQPSFLFGGGVPRSSSSATASPSSSFE